MGVCLTALDDHGIARRDALNTSSRGGESATCGFEGSLSSIIVAVSRIKSTIACGSRAIRNQLFKRSRLEAMLPSRRSSPSRRNRSRSRVTSFTVPSHQKPRARSAPCGPGGPHPAPPSRGCSGEGDRVSYVRSLASFLMSQFHACVVAELTAIRRAQASQIQRLRVASKVRDEGKNESVEWATGIPLRVPAGRSSPSPHTRPCGSPGHASTTRPGVSAQARW